MAIRWQRELPQLLILLVMVAVTTIVWADTPDSLPVHWNLAGDVDRYGGKAEALLFGPVFGLVMYLILLFAPRLSGTPEARLGGRYVVVRYAVLLLIAGIHGLLLAQIRGMHIDIGRIIPVLVGALFVALGSTMGKVEPNGIMGVRTPWTLSSRAAWDASQRLGGQLFMAAGSVFIVGALLGAIWMVLAGGIMLFAGVIALVWYGYRICRSDPQRLPPGQSLLS